MSESTAPARFPTFAPPSVQPAWMVDSKPGVVPVSFERRGQAPGRGAASNVAVPPAPRAPVPATPAPGSRSVPPPASELTVALEGRIEAFATAAVELAVARSTAVRSMEAPLLDLAVHIAAAIVDHEIEQHPEIHGALAKQALASLGDASQATLRASREAYDALVDVHGEAVIAHDGVRVEVTLDPDIEGLGCVADNSLARVDGRVTERLRGVRRALMDEHRRRLAEDDT